MWAHRLAAGAQGDIHLKGHHADRQDNIMESSDAGRFQCVRERKLPQVRRVYVRTRIQVLHSSCEPPTFHENLPVRNVRPSSMPWMSGAQWRWQCRTLATKQTRKRWFYYSRERWMIQHSSRIGIGITNDVRPV